MYIEMDAAQRMIAEIPVWSTLLTLNNFLLDLAFHRSFVKAKGYRRQPRKAPLGRQRTGVGINRSFSAVATVGRKGKRTKLATLLNRGYTSHNDAISDAFIDAHGVTWDE